MKKIYSLLFAFAVLFSACDDKNKTIVPEEATPPVLTSNNTGTFVLKKIEETETFQTFEWNNADFKMSVAPQYVLQVDRKDNNFANPKSLFTGITSPFKTTIGEFNKALLTAGFAADETHELEIRVIAGNHLSTDIVLMKVTTYFDADPWSLIGAAIGGWDPANDVFMNYDVATETYNITVDMKPGPFKFRNSKADKNPWKVNLGLNGDEEKTIDNIENETLKDDGKNIKVSGGNYTISLNVKKKTFTIKQNSKATYTDWTKAKLDAVGDGISTENTSAVTDPSGWKWGNKLLADNNGIAKKDGATYTWTWNNVVLEANKGFKLRTENGVAASNGIDFNVGLSAVDKENSTKKLVTEGDNIGVTVKGKYIITLKIDAANGNAKTLTITEPAPEYPENLYMIGNAVGGWTWETNDIKMIPVNGTPHQFWSIVWLEAAGIDGIKFSSVQNWKGINFGYDTDLKNGEYSKGGTNIPSPATAGYYMVVVDLKQNKISITDPKVYLIGETIDKNYVTKDPRGLLTVDNANKKITITKTLAAGDLRMYASHSYFNDDWWRTEFIVLKNKIEFRGNGGDQKRVSIAGVETTIDLNFKTLAGSITQ
jgi:hypothetical protein